MAVRQLNPPGGLIARYFGPYVASPTTYYYWVRANYVNGSSIFSGPVSVAVNGSPGKSGGNNGPVELIWDPTPGAINYDILRTTTSTLPVNASMLLRGNHSAANYTDDGTDATASFTVAFGPGNLRVAHATLNFAVDGGAVSTITPSDSDTIPATAILVAGQVNVTTAVTSGGSATVGIGTSAGSSTTAILAATAKASLTVDALINVVPTFAAAVKMTAAGQITFTVAAAALTAGVIEVWVLYFIASAA